jgi:ferredoxin
MPKIEAETANGTVAFEGTEGKKLVLALEDEGIDILHRCGGNARCTTCRVEVLAGDPGEIGELERDRLAMESELADTFRLCSSDDYGELDHTVNYVIHSSQPSRRERVISDTFVSRQGFIHCCSGAHVSSGTPPLSISPAP